MTAVCHLESVIPQLARLYPWPVDSSDDLRLAIHFLDWDVTPPEVLRAGYGAGILTTAFVSLLLFVVPTILRPAVVLGALSLGLLAVHTVHTLPLLLATARRTSALGAAPDLVSQAVLSMRLSPTPERAAAFAARTDDGRLASSLGRHVRQARHTARSGLSTFGDAWADLFPSLRRSFALVAAAGQAPPSDRDRLLDRALAVVLEGTNRQMQDFAAEIRTPATMLYAFGILLPTALVALLPAAGAAGLPITPVSVVLIYNVVLPGIIVASAAWLLSRRPVAFPPPQVTAEHPDVEDSTRMALLAGVSTAIAAWLAAALVFPAWAPPIAALGLGIGVTLWLRYRPVVSVYEDVRAVEAGLSDALALIGRRVANGHAVETAITHAADEVDGKMGTVLASGASKQRQLQMGVREAFLGQHGALATVPSPRVRGSMALLAVAATEGRPAGGALLALAEHVDDLQEIEQDARHAIANVSRTLRSTGMLFGPLVAGSTVALAAGMTGEDALPGGDQSLGWLGAPVGLYVLLLAVLLTALATGLTRGFDRALVGYRVGLALPCATVAYFGSYLLVGLIA